MDICSASRVLKTVPDFHLNYNTENIYSYQDQWKEGTTSQLTIDKKKLFSEVLKPKFVSPSFE